MTTVDDKPLFSIVMATYNRSQLLSRAVNSVLKQTYPHFELIIIDDASTDNTEQVCQSFRDKRIIYRKQEKNKGALAARNIGFDLAKGNYVALFDDDDELLPTALEVSVTKFRELSPQDISILWFDAMDAERKKHSGSGIRNAGMVSYKDLLCGRISGDYWLVLRRDLLGKDGKFDEDLPYGETLLWLRLHREHKAYYFPIPLLLVYRRHGGDRMCQHETIIRNLSRFTFTHKIFLERYGEEQKRLCPKAYGRQLGVLGGLYILNYNKIEGRRMCQESLKYHVGVECLAFLLLSYVASTKYTRWLFVTYDRIRNSW